MSINRSIRDTLLKQTKELGFQLTLGKEIRKSVNVIADTESELEISLESEIGTREEELDLKKKLEKLLKNQKSLAINKKILVDSHSVLGLGIAKNLRLQEIENQKLVKLTKERLKLSRSVRSNLAVGFFGGLAEIAGKLGGTASQLSIAFEEAEKAARQVVIDSKRTTQKESEQVQRLKDIKAHIDSGGKFTKSEAKKWGLLSSNSKLLTGGAAKQHAKTITSSLPQIEANSNPFKRFFNKVPKSGSASPKTMGKAFAAGFKSFGKALPGVGLAILAVQGVALAVKAIKGIFSLLEGASKQSAELSNNLLISRESARDLMHDANGIVYQYNQLAQAEGRMTVLRSDMITGNKILNEELGLQMNFMTGMGDIMSENTIEAGKMKTYLGFTDSTIARMTMDATKSGKSLREFTDDALFNIADTSRGAGVFYNYKELLNEASSLSGRQRAAMGGDVDVIAQNLVKMKAFGGNLSALEGGAAVLTNVESSIAAEMEIYAITGVHLDLSKARYYAETNNLRGFHREMNNQLARIGGLEKYDLATQELIISAFGISLDDYYQMRADAKEQSALAAKQQTLDEFLNSNELAAELMKIDDFDISDIDIKEKMQQLDVGKQIEMMREKGIAEHLIRQEISSQIRKNMEQESASEKSAKMWRRTTEILVDKMGNGEWFDSLTDILVGFAFYTIPRIIEFLSDTANFVNTSIAGASTVIEFFGGSPIENRVKFTSASGDELTKMKEDLKEYESYRSGRSLTGKDIGRHSPTEAFERMFAMDVMQTEYEATNLTHGSARGEYRREVFYSPLQSEMATNEGTTMENYQFTQILDENTESAMNYPSFESFDVKKPEDMSLEELREGKQYFESKREEIAAATQSQIKTDLPSVQAGIETAMQEYSSLPSVTREIAEQGAQNIRNEAAVASAAPLTNILLNEGNLLGGVEGAYASTNVSSGLQGDIISFPGEEPIRLPAGSLNLSTLGGIAGNMTKQSSLTANSKTMLTAALENLLEENNLVIEGSSVGQIS